MIAAFNYAKGSDLALFVLGGGSNVLIADEGFDGLVLQAALKGISSAQEKDGTVYVTAGAGEDWDDFVAYCVGRDLQGLECLSGIPGFVGGTPVQNVGAYGQEVSESIVSVHVFDRKEGEVRMLTNADCGFAYRTSIFNTVERRDIRPLGNLRAERRGPPEDRLQRPDRALRGQYPRIAGNPRRCN